MGDSYHSDVKGLTVGAIAVGANAHERVPYPSENRH